MAVLIVDALMDAKIVQRDDMQKAIEIAQEEILVRFALLGLI